MVLPVFQKYLGRGAECNGGIISGLGLVNLTVKKAIFTIGITLFSAIAFAAEAMAQGCAMCKENAAAAGERIANGFNYGILAMVFLPATLVSGVTLFVIRASYLKKHPESTLSTFGIIREYLKERRDPTL